MKLFLSAKAKICFTVFLSFILWVLYTALHDPSFNLYVRIFIILLGIVACFSIGKSFYNSFIFIDDTKIAQKVSFLWSEIFYVEDISAIKVEKRNNVFHVEVGNTKNQRKTIEMDMWGDKYQVDQFLERLYFLSESVAKR